MYQRIISALIALSLSTSGASGAVADSFEGTVETDKTSDPTPELTVSDAVIAEAEYDYEFKGEGMCVAVLDTGFYLEHESFMLTTSGRLTKEAVDGAELSFETDESCYVSEKIPFAYNYADKTTDVSGYEAHGTAILSAVGMNNVASPEHSNGAAPEAQLLAMKVFSSLDGSISPDAVNAAIDDAIVLGADVICIAFGSDCGSSDGGKYEFEAAIERAREAGVIVVASVGEVRRIGELSPYSLDAGLIAPTTENPDVGVVSYPAASDNVLSVSSAETNVYSADCFLLGELRIPYGDTNNMWEKPSGGVSFAKYFDGQTLEYEFVPSYGRVEDLEGIELTGKLAVIERGVTTFAEKCQNAADKGAVGAIIIDNQPDQDSALTVRMDISESPIPAVIISSSNGERLKKAEKHEITVSFGEHYYSLGSETPTPSSYAAWGTTPELTLKPELSITAEAIECASSDGGYITTGGASVAAGRLSGMLVCLKQKLICDGHTPRSAAEYARLIIASSAELMKRADENYYSPRLQGSGAASLGASLCAELLISSDNKSKIELYELSKRTFKLEVTVENLSDSEKLCSLETVIGSDGYDSFYFSDLDSSEKSPKLSEKLGKLPSDEVSFVDTFKPFENATIYLNDESRNFNAYSSEGEKLTFKLSPGESRKLTLNTVIDRETLSEYERIYPNGFFVEGFVLVSSEGERASIPFVGFMGDFSKADTLDAELYSGDQTMYDSIYLWRNISTSSYSDRMLLGTDPFDPKSSADREALFLSPTVDPSNGEVYMNLALLRSIDDAVVRVYRGDELISERELGYIPRTYLEYSTNMPISQQIALWDGRADDNRYYVFPDGEYRIVLSYRTVGAGSEKQLTFTLILDSTKPTLESYEFFEEGENALLRLNAVDENGILRCYLRDELYNEAKPDDSGAYDVTAFGKYIYVELCDGALNSSVYRLDNPYFVEYYE